MPNTVVSVVLVAGVQGAPVVVLEEDEDEEVDELEEEEVEEEALFELFAVDVGPVGLSYFFVHANAKKTANPNKSAQ